MYNGALPFFAGLTIAHEEKEIDWDKIFVEEGVYLELSAQGLPYAVFPDNSYTWEYLQDTDSVGMGHWTAYENGVCLQNTIGL